MKALICKDCLLTRWVHGLALAFGLLILPIGLDKPEAFLFFTLFMQLMYIRLMYNLTRPGLCAGKENLLLGSLPLRRGNVVTAKYAFYFGCVLLYPLYQCILIWVTTLFGVALPFPLWIHFLMPAILGVLYCAIMLPAAYISPKWSGVLSMLIYLAIIILPQRLPQWLGIETDVKTALASMASALRSWSLPVLFVICLGLMCISMQTSRHFYKKTEF